MASGRRTLFSLIDYTLASVRPRRVKGEGEREGEREEGEREMRVVCVGSGGDPVRLLEENVIQRFVEALSQKPIPKYSPGVCVCVFICVCVYVCVCVFMCVL